MKDGRKAFLWIALSRLSMIQDTWRTQAMTLKSG